MKIIDKLKSTLWLRFFTLVKIPLIAYLKPSIIELDSNKCIVKFPLFRRSKNHLNSMYFGALCAGADCAGGVIALDQIAKSKKNVSFVFKDFQAEFLKRAEGDVHFICEQGPEIRKAVNETIETGQRVNVLMDVKAIVPSKSKTEPAALFKLTLSLKKV